MYIKFKASQNMMTEGNLMDSNEVHLQLNDPPEYINEFIEDFEEKLDKKKIDLDEEEVEKEEE